MVGSILAPPGLQLLKRKPSEAVSQLRAAKASCSASESGYPIVR
eukprot:SAG22_NODE_5696_length_970_cov_1.074627_2_plen_43_part_01